MLWVCGPIHSGGLCSGDDLCRERRCGTFSELLEHCTLVKEPEISKSSINLSIVLNIVSGALIHGY